MRCGGQRACNPASAPAYPLSDMRHAAGQKGRRRFPTRPAVAARRVFPSRAARNESQRLSRVRRLTEDQTFIRAQEDVLAFGATGAVEICRQQTFLRRAFNPEGLGLIAHVEQDPHALAAKLVARRREHVGLRTEA